MHGLATLRRINAEAQPERTDPEHLFHPIILDLRRTVNRLPVGSEYRRWLRYTLWQNAQWFIDRVEPAQDDGWSNLEALQQTALGNMAEASLQALLQTR